MDESEIKNLFLWLAVMNGTLQISLRNFDGQLMVDFRASIRSVESIQAGCGFDKVYLQNPLEIQAGVIKQLKEKITS